MEIRPVRIAADYQAAQAAIEVLQRGEGGPLATDQLEVLSLLAEAWEDLHYPVGYAEEIEVILSHMEQSELNADPVG